MKWNQSFFFISWNISLMNKLHHLCVTRDFLKLTSIFFFIQRSMICSNKRLPNQQFLPAGLWLCRQSSLRCPQTSRKACLFNSESSYYNFLLAEMSVWNFFALCWQERAAMEQSILLRKPVYFTLKLLLAAKIW